LKHKIIFIITTIIALCILSAPTTLVWLALDAAEKDNRIKTARILELEQDYNICKLVLTEKPHMCLYKKKLCIGV